MKRLGCLLSVPLLLVVAVAFAGNATGRFDQKLSADKQIVHVLNRLTFGPHPGDAEQVRRLGVGAARVLSGRLAARTRGGRGRRRVHRAAPRPRLRARSRLLPARQHLSRARHSEAGDVADSGKVLAGYIGACDAAAGGAVNTYSAAVRQIDELLGRRSPDTVDSVAPGRSPCGPRQRPATGTGRLARRLGAGSG